MQTTPRHHHSRLTDTPEPHHSAAYTAYGHTSQGHVGQGHTEQGETEEGQRSKAESWPASDQAVQGGECSESSEAGQTATPSDTALHISVNVSPRMALKTGGGSVSSGASAEAQATSAAAGNTTGTVSAMGNKLEKMPSGADIMIGLEDESGTHQPVEIDVADEDSTKEAPPPEVPKEKRRVSITERVLKQRNSEQQLLILQEKAESRKRELEELLDEHAQLVHEVATLSESTTSLASDDMDSNMDKENHIGPGDMDNSLDKENQQHDQ